MRRGLVQTGAWAVATGAAVALSWLGVNTALSEAAFEPPQAPPLPTTSSAAVPPSTAGASVTVPDRTAPDVTTLGGTAPSQTTQPPTVPTATVPTPVAHSPAATHRIPVSGSGSATPSTVQSYLLPGGRVALDIHPDSAELVSAIPDAGWQMSRWNGDQWMRIDFKSDSGRVSSLFVTWNGHPPDIQSVPG